MNNNHLKFAQFLYENGMTILDLFTREKELLDMLTNVEGYFDSFQAELAEVKKYSEEIVKKRQYFNDLFMRLQHPKEIKLGVVCPTKKQHFTAQLMTYMKELSFEFDLDIILFSIDDLDLEKDIVKGTLISGLKAEEAFTVIPRFIYNVTMHTKYSSVQKMKQLRKREGITVVNPINRLNQSVVFDIIHSLPQSNQYLPAYTSLSSSSVTEFIKEHQTVYLIPERGSIHTEALEIKMIEKEQYMISLGQTSYITEGKELFTHLKELTRNKKYMTLEGPPLLTWMDVPLEARVYVQKNSMGHWEVTELIAKSELFSKGSIYHHMSEQLQKVLLDLLPNETNKLIKKLINYSVESCTYLDYYIPDLGSCKLDFVFSKNADPLLMFVGGWEHNDYFYNVKEQSSWSHYIKNTFHYLRFLLHHSLSHSRSDVHVD
jgi:hypothetical protein